MRSAMFQKFAEPEPAPMFKYAHDLSNIRCISITDTGAGAVVGIQLSGMPDTDASVENVALQVRVDHGNRQREIDEMMCEALHQALRAIQHEIALCEIRSAVEKA